MKLKAASLLCMGGVLLCGMMACSNQAKQSTEVNNDEQQLFIGDDIAVAQTQYGKVKGFILRGIYNFRGVPYGASTAGENRFMPPREPEPWEGVRPAVRTDHGLDVLHAEQYLRSVQLGREFRRGQRLVFLAHLAALPLHP